MKKAVLLLHGWLSNLDDFDTIIPFLKTKYHHVERIVYPGHGKGENYFDFDAEKTIELVDDTFLKLKEKYQIVDVIGYSMGGALAVNLSKKYDFRKLILLAPANKYFNFIVPFSKFKFLIKNFFELEKAFIRKSNEEIEVWKEKFRAIREDDKKSLQFVKDKYLKSYFRHAYKNFHKVIEICNEGLTEIKNPCFIAWGNLDQLVPKESGKHLFELCTNEVKQLKIYDDICHLMLLSEHYEDLKSDIEEFLND